MTMSEGFEVWYHKHCGPQTTPHLVIVRNIAEEVWLAACQFQRERDAEIVEEWLPPFPLSGEEAEQTLNRNALIAAAIREGG